MTMNIIQEITNCKTLAELDKLREKIIECIDNCDNVEDAEYIQKTFVTRKNKIRRNGGRLK